MEPVVQLIGLSGYAGSGKSEAARILIASGWDRRKFAAPLKGMLQFFLAYQGAQANHIQRMIEGDLKEVPSLMLGGQTPRHAMQALGTEWGRMRMSDSLWVDAAMRDLPPRAVFDDCRFENEAAAIRQRDGIIVRIVRPGVGPVNSHVSEVLVKPDHVIMNDSDLSELRLRVLRLIL
jgi:hypothetical protein